MISEESALLNVQQTGDLGSIGRIDTDEPMADLGAVFAVNCLVSPFGNATSSLVAPDAAEGMSDWLKSTHVREEDGIVGEVAEQYSVDVAFCTLDALADRLGLGAEGLDFLPDNWTDWRVHCDIYILVDRIIYTLTDEFAARYRALTERELGLAYSQRLLPFADDEQPDAIVFMVAVPSRFGAIGGVRSHRSTMVQAGVGLETTRRGLVSTTGTWEWHTEFFDDAVCDVLGVDGVDAFPVAVGALVPPTVDLNTDESETDDHTGPTGGLA